MPPIAATTPIDHQIRKGSAELLVLAQLEGRPRHGYEIGRRIELQSDGAIQFHVASLYPLLYRLEGRGWIRGRWVEKAGERRKRFYRITPAGKEALAAQRAAWRDFMGAVHRIAGIEPARGATR